MTENTSSSNEFGFAERRGSPSGNGHFSGKTCVISGGTLGLGLATAELFKARGAANMMLVARNAERGEAVASELNDDDCAVRFHQADMSDAATVATVMPAVDAAFGRIDVLVNAAALTVRGTLTDTSVADWDLMQAVNARAPFQLTQGAVAIMRREAIEGTIVNIGSVASHASIPRLLPYAVSKAALTTMTKNIAYSVMRDRIRINILNLGWMNTPSEDAIQREFEGATDGWLERAAAEQPFGRLIEPTEAARTIAFLASEESGMLTGAAIDYDQSVTGAGDAPSPGPDERG